MLWWFDIILPWYKKLYWILEKSSSLVFTSFSWTIRMILNFKLRCTISVSRYQWVPKESMQERSWMYQRSRKLSLRLQIWLWRQKLWKRSGKNFTIHLILPKSNYYTRSWFLLISMCTYSVIPLVTMLKTLMTPIEKYSTTLWHLFVRYNRRVYDIFHCIGERAIFNIWSVKTVFNSE